MFRRWPDVLVSEYFCSDICQLEPGRSHDTAPSKITHMSHESGNGREDEITQPYFYASPHASGTSASLPMLCQPSRSPGVIHQSCLRGSSSARQNARRTTYVPDSLSPTVSLAWTTSMPMLPRSHRAPQHPPLLSSCAKLNPKQTLAAPA